MDRRFPGENRFSKGGSSAKEKERDIFDRNFSRMKIFCAKFNTGGETREKRKEKKFFFTERKKKREI